MTAPDLDHKNSRWSLPADFVDEINSLVADPGAEEPERLYAIRDYHVGCLARKMGFGKLDHSIKEWRYTHAERMAAIREYQRRQQWNSNAQRRK